MKLLPGLIDEIGTLGRAVEVAKVEEMNLINKYINCDICLTNC
ncbi:MAG: hypothetical protein ACLU4J_05285 [Butyricimonas paravirosa]